MSTTRTVALALLAVLLIAATPASQAPRDTPGDAAEDHRNAAEAESEANVRPPSGATNDQGNSRPTQQHTEPSPDYARENLAAYQTTATWTFWLFVATVALVGVGVGVGLGQLGLMRGSLRAARDAANAAKISADVASDSLRADQRPRVILSIPAYVFVEYGRGTPHRAVGFEIRNYGKTPAVQLGALLWWDTTTEAERFRESSDYAEMMAADVISAPSPTFHFATLPAGSGHHYTGRLGLDDKLSDVMEGKTRLYVCIRLAYWDCLGTPKPYTATFIFMNEPKTWNLMRVGLGDESDQRQRQD